MYAHSICSEMAYAWLRYHILLYTLRLQPSSPFQMARKASSARMTQTSGKAARAECANFS